MVKIKALRNSISGLLLITKIKDIYYHFTAILVELNTIPFADMRNKYIPE